MANRIVIGKYGKRKRTYECFLCYQPFPSNSFLRRHMQDKHLHPHYLCKCSKIFSRKNLLKRHKNNCLSAMLLTKSAWKTQDKMVTIREKYHHWTLEERKENADRLREEVMIKQKIRGLSNAPLTAQCSSNQIEFRINIFCCFTF